MILKPNIGKFGEDVACLWLNGNGFFVIERNFLRKWGEIDVVAKHTDGTLVFVEVKTMVATTRQGFDSVRDLIPEDQITSFKLHKLRRVCNGYANNSHHLHPDLGWRIDVVAIELPFNYSILVRNKLTEIIKIV